MRREYGRRAQWSAFWTGLLTYATARQFTQHDVFWGVFCAILLTLFCLCWFGERLLDEGRAKR